jgi:hypothetical protein
MTLSRETVLELMALADGELDGDERARAEQVVAQNTEAKALLSGFRAAQLGRWIAAAEENRVSAADGIGHAVMARVAQQAAEEGGGVRFAHASGRARDWRVGVAAPAAFAALALAAGVALMASGGEREAEPNAPAPVASVAVPVASDEEPSARGLAMHAPVAPMGVEVDEIDTQSRDVSVFEIPVGAAAAANASQPSSVVIMIEEEPGRK